MRHVIIGLFLLIGAPLFAQEAPVIPFDSVPNALKLPANMYFGEVAGVAVNSKKHTFVFSRGNTTGPAFGAAAAQLLEFGPDGKFLREIVIKVPFDRNTARPAIGNMPAEDVKGTQSPGAPWAICITPGPRQVLYSADAFPGRVYKLTLDGKVLGVLGESGKQLNQFGWVHEIACPSENEIYVAEVLNWRVQKLILHPGQQTSAANR